MADEVTYANILYRIATINGNPKGFLLDILQQRFTRVLDSTSGKVIISSTTGGSSATWAIPQGMDDMAIMRIAELALQICETGINENDGTTPIEQVALSKRPVSYGQFSMIRR